MAKYYIGPDGGQIEPTRYEVSDDLEGDAMSNPTRPDACPACGASPNVPMVDNEWVAEFICGVFATRHGGGQWNYHGTCRNAYDAAVALRAELAQVKAELAMWGNLRREFAKQIGGDPETWPDHGNAPLAIAAAHALDRLRLDSANEQLAAARAHVAALAEVLEVGSWTLEAGPGYTSSSNIQLLISNFQAAASAAREFLGETK